MEAIADFMNRKGWECPVCHIGLAPTCQACPECIRAKNAPKGSSYATTDNIKFAGGLIGGLPIGSAGTDQFVFTEAIGNPYTTTSSSVHIDIG